MQEKCLRICTFARDFSFGSVIKQERSMLRMFVWFLILYCIYKILSLFLLPPEYRSSPRKRNKFPSPPYHFPNEEKKKASPKTNTRNYGDYVDYEEIK